MERFRNRRLGNIVQSVEFEKNIRLEKYVAKIEKVLIQNGYNKCHIPQADFSTRYLAENDPEGMSDLYKVVAGDGQMLALPNEPSIALLNTLVLRRDEPGRYFGKTDSFSFLKPTNPQNGYYLTAVLTCANGYESEAEICGLAVEIADAIGIKSNLRMSNTEIAQGVVDYYAQRAESRDKIKKILLGDVQTEGDFAASQIFTELKNMKEENVKTYVQELSKKLDNKRSIDGVVDVYEVLNLLETQCPLEKVDVDPLYVGDDASVLGMCYCIGDDSPVIYGGRRIYCSGGEAMGVVTLTVDLTQLAFLLNALPKEQPRMVEILVGDSVTAYRRALRFKADFLKSGLVSQIRYKVGPEEADKLIEERNGKEYLVVYIAEDGSLKHN